MVMPGRERLIPAGGVVHGDGQVARGEEKKLVAGLILDPPLAAVAYLDKAASLCAVCHAQRGVNVVIAYLYSGKDRIDREQCFSVSAAEAVYTALRAAADNVGTPALQFNFIFFGTHGYAPYS